MRLWKKRLDDQDKPIPVIEVEEKPRKGRVILLAICVTVAVVALGIWLYGVFHVDPGWYTIEANTTEQNCGSEFAFSYNVGASGNNAKEERNAVTDAYTAACVEAYKQFAWESEDTSVKGIRYINDNPNTVVRVDPRLYAALALAKDNPLLYMGPVTAEYSRMFQYDEEYLAAEYDPMQNPEVMAYVKELIGFVSSREHIRLELLENDRVKLIVSQEYADFIEKYYVERVFDLGWMRNAFVADFLADAMEEKGYTLGYLVSFDGFGCYLGGEYTISLSDRVGFDLYRPATFSLNAGTRTVSLRNYPLPENGLDTWRYFFFQSTGEISSVFVDPADGVCKSSTDNLLCYSEKASCAEIVLACAPLFLTEELDESALVGLAGDGIQTVWAEGKELRYTEQDLSLTLDQEAGYTKKHVSE